MATAKPPPAPSANRLLAALPPAEYRRLLPRLEAVGLPFRQVLYPPGGPIDHVYFPSRGVVSVVAVMADRRTIEVGLVGREGVVGAGAILGDPTSPYKVLVQVEGDGVRIGTEDFRAAAGPGGPLHRLLARYHAAFLTQVSQSVACNGLHPVARRCCKWLLMTQDRMGAESFGLTHEFLGKMLGVRRASVTDVLRPLEADGLVGHTRGRVTVRDRAGLEAAACECYRFVRDQFDRLLP
jgi:CRP-like cAMP-binding protein